MFSNDPQKTALAGLLRAATRETAPETLAAIRALLHSHDAAVLAGHVMLDLLEENGYGPLDIDAIGATPADLPLALAIQHAAASRGMQYDAFTIAGTSLIGPDLDGRRVVVIKIFEDETAPAKLAVEATAALVGRDFAAYQPTDLEPNHE
ncbi:Uncharacterised protein [Arcanobacterium haemolyticum]|uniref:hypothetical protein n=1 Tax=Arcanobacterium haemolyticum TaxID=28264 RepID=UPI000D86FF4B|nr:hypothetical protein [Arcanobacterium haemolyticum]SPT74571.1 Uncharacterised protein [Arcanobacterium haemolyticum]